MYLPVSTVYMYVWLKKETTVLCDEETCDEPGTTNDDRRREKWTKIMVANRVENRQEKQIDKQAKSRLWYRNQSLMAPPDEKVASCATKTTAPLAIKLVTAVFAYVIK